MRTSNPTWNNLRVESEMSLPCVLSAVRLQEVLVTVLGEESHKLIVGPVLDDSERAEKR